MVNISKRFGGLKALDSVSFCARAGEVHALMGENGAGKSTLIKILAGAYSKDDGDMYLGGKKANLTNPRSAHEHGISVIYQEFALAPHLTVAENIFIDNLGSGKRIVNWKKLKKNAKDMLSHWGFRISMYHDRCPSSLWRISRSWKYARPFRGNQGYWCLTNRRRCFLRMKLNSCSASSRTSGEKGSASSYLSQDRRGTSNLRQDFRSQGRQER